MKKNEINEEKWRKMKKNKYNSLTNKSEMKWKKLLNKIYRYLI